MVKKILKKVFRSSEKAMQKPSKISSWRFGLAFGIISAFFVLVVSVLIYFQYAPLFTAMFYDLFGYLSYSSALSWKTLLSMLYGFIDGFVLAFLVAWVYNRFL